MKKIAIIFIIGVLIPTILFKTLIFLIIFAAAVIAGTISHILD